MKKNLPVNKYELYEASVQSPLTDVKFFKKVYRELQKSDAKSLREDFCGTFVLSCEWVKFSPKHRAIAIDVDTEPLYYGRSHHLKNLTESQKNRLIVRQADVLNPGLPHADIIAAMNFSHFTFKDRSVMKSYFHNAITTLNKKGILVVDVLGGPLCLDASEDKTKFEGFTYFWEQKSYNPITHHAEFAIHFQQNRKEKMHDVFTYSWRIWTIPEIREMMKEVGFKKTFVYWEGTTKSGQGNGIYKLSETGDDSGAWIAYVVGVI